MAVDKGVATPGKGKLILALALLSPIAIVMAPSTLVLMAGMIPTAVAAMVDSGPGRRLTCTVAATNLIGSLYFLDSLWAIGQSFANVSLVLGDSFGWLVALSGAGVGWMIFGIMPTLVHHLSAARASVRQRKIKRQQDRLVEEWGEGIRHRPQPEN
jgi:hypothetical protein